MTLQQLNYLVKVSECGNVTEAAEKLYLSQPSLSAAIRHLEEEMGVKAFVRTNKGVSGNECNDRISSMIERNREDIFYE